MKTKHKARNASTAPPPAPAADPRVQAPQEGLCSALRALPKLVLSSLCTRDLQAVSHVHTEHIPALSFILFSPSLFTESISFIVFQCNRLACQTKCWVCLLFWVVCLFLFVSCCLFGWFGLFVFFRRGELVLFFGLAFFVVCCSVLWFLFVCFSACFCGWLMLLSVCCFQTEKEILCIR